MQNVNVFLADRNEGVIKQFEKLENELRTATGIVIVGKAMTEQEGKENLQALKEIDVFLIDESFDRHFLSYCQKNFPYARFLYLTKKMDRERTMPTGVSGVLFKPFTLKGFIQKLTQVMEEKNVDFEEIDRQYKAISDGTRRKILDLLKEKSLTAGEIADNCQMTKPNISQHLNVLKKSGFIEEEKKGLYVHYTLKDYHLLKANKEVHGLISIKDKILGEVKKISEEKKCEPIVAAIDSQDDGIISIMKGNVTVVTLHFSFRLSSFLVEVETPSGGEEIKITYQDAEGLTRFFGTVRTIIEAFENEYKEKEKEKDSIKARIKAALQENYQYQPLVSMTLKEAKTKLKDDIVSLMEQLDIKMPTVMQDEFVQDVLLENTLFGKLTPLYEEASVAEIMVNGPDDVWIERRGKLEKTDITFKNDAEINELAKRIASSIGRRIDNLNPVVSARMPDESRVHIVIPPVARKGVSITILKVTPDHLTMANLVDFGAISKEEAEFLRMAVESGANMIISGGAGTGKTTSLRNLAQMIPDNERIVTIEDYVELRLQHPHVVELEARLPNQEGVGGVTATDLLKTARLMRPERIILGEMRHDSMLSFLETCKQGHHGVMTTISNSHKEGIFPRIINSVLSTGTEYSEEHIKQLIGENIDLIVHFTLVGGRRRLTEIAEVVGYNNKTGNIDTKKLFVWESEGVKNGEVMGTHYYNGYQLSNDLQLKFERKGFGKLTFDDQKMKKKKQKEAIQKQLPDLVLSLAGALKSGYTMSQAFEVIGSETVEPIASEVRIWANALRDGKTMQQALTEAKERIDVPDFSLLANTLMLKAVHKENSERALRRVCQLLEARENVYRSLPDYKKEKVLTSIHWGIVEFLDLLQIAMTHSNNLAEALTQTGTYFENAFSKEIRTVLTEVECGKRLREALRNMAKRMDNPEVDLLVSQLNQAEVFGNDLESVIQIQSEKIKKSIMMML